VHLSSLSDFERADSFAGIAVRSNIQKPYDASSAIFTMPKKFVTGDSGTDFFKFLLSCRKRWKLDWLN